MYNSTAMVFVEVIEPNKAPDKRYISIGTSDNMPDSYLKSKALNIFKEEKDYPIDTQFTVTGIHRFGSLSEYMKFLEGQINDFMNSDEE